MVSALAALVLGLAAPLYAVWPLLGAGRPTEPLEDDGGASGDADDVRAAVLGWAVAAGELDAGTAGDEMGSGPGVPTV